MTFWRNSHCPVSPCDAGTLWDVIEHVSDPNALLAETVRVLAPGGVLFLQAGNAAFQVPKGHIVEARSKVHGEVIRERPA